MKAQYLMAVFFLAASMLAFPAAAENLTLEGPLADKISYYNDAVDLANEGSFDQSLVLLDRALEMDSNFTLAYVAKSGVLSATGDYEGALEAADMAVLLNPDQADAQVNRATVLIMLERYEEALEAADKAIALEPADTDTMIAALLNKGTALGGLGRYEEELLASEKAIEISPNDNRAWANKNYAEQMMEKESGGQQSPVSPLTLILGVAAAVFCVSAKKRSKKE